MKLTQFISILFSELNSLKPAKTKYLRANVDKSGLWNGKIDAYNLRVRNVPASASTILVTNVYELTILLSTGRLVVTFIANDSDVKAFSYEYHLPAIDRWYQPLKRNCIKRNVIVSENELNLRKVINKKFDEFMKAIEKWYAASTINILNFNPQNTRIMDAYSTDIMYLMGSIGRARLCAEIHKQRCEYLGMNTNADNISKLLNQLSNEIQLQLTTNSKFENTQYNESF